MVEVELAQGWARGIKICFGNRADSQERGAQDFYHVHQVHGRELWSVQDGLQQAVKADGLYVQGSSIQSLKHPLGIRTADCLPLIYVDRESQVIAAVHAGWRGLAQGIHLRLFEEGICRPQTTWVWVGPSLNGEHFEVEADMWSQFGLTAENPRYFERHRTCPEKRFFYVWNFVRGELEKAGVELVYLTGVDTYQEEEYFSYRRLKASGEWRAGFANWSWVGPTERFLR